MCLFFLYRHPFGYHNMYIYFNAIKLARLLTLWEGYDFARECEHLPIAALSVTVAAIAKAIACNAAVAMLRMHPSSQGG